MHDDVDCLIAGGGPAGLTAALYLARFRRRVLLIDGGSPRAAWIPESHNIPFFAHGIAGPEIVRRAQETLRAYDVPRLSGAVTALRRDGDGFAAEALENGAARAVRARFVVLATGAVDVEPDLPDTPDAVRRGLVRYCPICDGYESRGLRLAVLGQGDKAVGEAAFLKRSYSGDVTVLTLGADLPAPARARAAEAGVPVITAPIEGLEVADGRIAAVQAGGRVHGFDVVYSALGLTYRTALADGLGAAKDAAGALTVDLHGQTGVDGLYAAGDVAAGLDQVVVGMAKAAIAATAIHNRLGDG